MQFPCLVSFCFSGILTISRKFSGLLAQKFSAFSGNLGQNFVSLGLFEMTVSGFLEIFRNISGSVVLMVCSLPNIFEFRVSWNFYFGFLGFYPKNFG